MAQVPTKPVKAVRVDLGHVFVDAAAGEYLRYRLTFKGAVASFALKESATQNLLLSHKSPTPDGKTFERRWPLAVDPVLVITEHVLLMEFLAADSYAYVCDLRGAGDSSRRTITDIDFTSNGFVGWWPHALSVTLYK